MNDHERLFASSESEVERLLLRAGRVGAGDGAKRRALAAASGVLVATSLTSSAAAGSGIGGKLLTSAKLASLLSVKWMTVAVVASVGVAAGTVAVRAVASRHVSPSVEVVAAAKRPGSGSGPAVQLSAAPTTGVSALPLAPEPSATGIVAIGAGPTGRTVVRQSPVNTAAVTVVTLESPRAMPVQKAILRPRGAVSAPRDPSVNSPPPSNPALELSMLDEAREAVAAGEPARALSTLNRYKERFSQGALSPEADVLRIEALVKAGDRSAASRVAEALLSANPQSPYRARIESILRTNAP